MKVLLVDDEKPARDRLRRLLKAHPDLEIVAEAADGISALRMIETLNIDLAFLDIDMPELSGLELAQSLAGKGPQIIFVTAHHEHALAAFEASALDYVVKPVHPTRLAQTLQKLKKLDSLQQQHELGQVIHAMPQLAETMKLAFRIGQNYEVIHTDQISAILALDHYAQVIVNQKEYLSEESLDVFEQRLASLGFLRIHRSALINLHFLSGLKRLGDRKYLAILNDFSQTEAPVSRERLPVLKEKLGLA